MVIKTKKDLLALQEQIINEQDKYIKLNELFSTATDKEEKTQLQIQVNESSQRLEKLKLLFQGIEKKNLPAVFISKNERKSKLTFQEKQESIDLFTRKLGNVAIIIGLTVLVISFGIGCYLVLTKSLIGLYFMSFSIHSFSSILKRIIRQNKIN